MIAVATRPAFGRTELTMTQVARATSDLGLVAARSRTAVQRPDSVNLARHRAPIESPRDDTGQRLTMRFPAGAAISSLRVDRPEICCGY